MKKIVIIVMLVMLSAGLATVSYGATKKSVAKPEAPAPSISDNNEESGPENRARVNGFKKCLSLVKKANEHVFGDIKYAYYATWNSKEIEKHGYSVQGLKYYSDGTAYGSYHVIPNVNGSCDALVTQTNVLEDNCSSAREKIYKEWTLQGTPKNGTTYLTKDGVDLFLISPANGGCHTIKQEYMTNMQP